MSFLHYTVCIVTKTTTTHMFKIWLGTIADMLNYIVGGKFSYIIVIPVLHVRLEKLICSSPYFFTHDWPWACKLSVFHTIVSFANL